MLNDSKNYLSSNQKPNFHSADKRPNNKWYDSTNQIWYYEQIIL